MKKILHGFCFSFCLLLIAPVAEAVTYANTAVTFNWIDATMHTKLGPTLGGVYSPLYSFSNTGGCGTAPPSIDDTLTGNIPIGFNFMYSGVIFTQVRVMSNGRLQFNNTTCGYGTLSAGPPQTYTYLYADASMNYTMRIYGSDLDPSLQSEVGSSYVTNCVSRASCYVSYATIGTAPYRSFVVTWSNVPEWTSFSSATGSYNLQIILQENGEFIYQYGTNIPGPGNTTAQVGWQADTNDYSVPAVGYPAINSAIKFYIPRPVAEYRMEQVSWNGTAGEVLDTSGNGRHGMAYQTGSTLPSEVAGGKVCRGGRITNNTTLAAISAIDTGITVPTTVGSVGTITFWYNNASNNTPGTTRMLFDASTVNPQWFYLTRSNTGTLSFVVTDNSSGSHTATVNNILPATGWSHIAVTWNFNNLAAANSDHLQIWVNGVMRRNSTFTVANPSTISASINTLYIGDNRSAVSPIAASAGASATTTDATLDEFRIYNYEGGLALIQRDMNQAGACLSHYNISHAGTGTICQAPITVTAHDASHATIIMPNNTTMIQLSTSTALGDWTLLNGYGVLNNGTANDGIATYLFNGEYQAVFGLKHSTAGSVNINVTDGQIIEGASEDASITLSSAICPQDFNSCHDYSTSHCSSTDGKLYTRLAGINSSYDIVKLNNLDNVETTFTGRAIVSLIARTATGGSQDPQNCFLSPDYTQVLDNAATNFALGKLSLTDISVPNVYRDARIKVVCDATNCPPLGKTWCSIDNFAIRPSAFTPSADLGGTELKAGLNFSMAAASGFTNYIGTPVLDTAKMRDHNDEAIGTLAGSFPAAVAGTSTDTFQYHDVGTLSLLTDAITDASFTSVDQPNDCTNNTSNTLAGGKYGCTIGSSTAGPWGRFYPHHFTYAATLTPACAAGNFTYMDQPALGIDLTLSAKSFNETTTTKYTAGYTTLGTFAITGDNGGTAVALSRITPALPAFVWSNGTYTANAANYTFAKLPANPDGAYDSYALLASVTDPDSVTITGSNSSNTTSVRFGRLNLPNNHGSELRGLPFALTTQFWANGGWTNNALDNCTTLPASSVRMAGYAQNLAACETVLSPVGNLNFAAGVVAGGLRLSAPGAGNTGSVNLTVNTAGAAGNTCLAAVPSAATDANLPWLTSTTGRATFGVYKGANQFIYMREAY